METTTEIKAMPADRFWAIIERTVRWNADQRAQYDTLRKELTKLKPVDIVAFARAYERERDRGLTAEVADALLIADISLSEDPWEYFLNWLLARGRRAFERVINEPDALADILPPGDPYKMSFEEFHRAVSEAWEARTGTNPYRFDANGGRVGDEPCVLPLGAHKRRIAFLSWLRAEKPELANDPDKIAAEYPSLYQVWLRAPRPQAEERRWGELPKRLPQLWRRLDGLRTRFPKLFDVMSVAASGTGAA